MFNIFSMWLLRVFNFISPGGCHFSTPFVTLFLLYNQLSHISTSLHNLNYHDTFHWSSCTKPQSKLPCIGVSIVPLSAIIGFDFLTFSTVWYSCMSFFYFMVNWISNHLILLFYSSLTSFVNYKKRVHSTCGSKW